MDGIGELSIFYTDAKTGCDVYVGAKERNRMNLCMTWTYLELKKHIFNDCGIREEAEKRGLGQNVEITVGRIDKKDFKIVQ